MKRLLSTFLQKWPEYLLEILVITMGVLGAFALNNWNEGIKNKQLEQGIYENLYSSLKSDSAQLTQILAHINASIIAQEMIIQKDLNQVLECCDPEKVLSDLYNGSFSFFPKYGAYNQIVSDGQLSMIRNEEIRNKLTDLYDYQFTRYENIDAIVDHKFQYAIDEVSAGKMEFVYYNIYQDNSRVVSNLNTEKFKTYYGDLQAATRSMYIITTDAKVQLMEIQSSINVILDSLPKELDE